MLFSTGQEGAAALRRFNERLATMKDTITRHNVEVIEVYEPFGESPSGKVQGGKPFDYETATNLSDRFAAKYASERPAFIVCLYGSQPGDTSRTTPVLAESAAYVEPAELLSVLK